MNNEFGFFKGVMYQRIPYPEINKIPTRLPQLKYDGKIFLVSPPTWDGIGGDVFLQLYNVENFPQIVRVLGEHREKILGKPNERRLD